MSDIMQNKTLTISEKHIGFNTMNSYICSFTEFLPFCLKVYYFSNFKDFNTRAQA